MAKIDSCGDYGAFSDQLRLLCDAQLTAQDLVQQGAIHAVSTLIEWGPSAASAQEMLASLRQSAQLIRDEAARRGKGSLFDADQTAAGGATSKEH